MLGTAVETGFVGHTNFPRAQNAFRGCKMVEVGPSRQAAFFGPSVVCDISWLLNYRGLESILCRFGYARLPRYHALSQA
jgi:hypothetical protein